MQASSRSTAKRFLNDKADRFPVSRLIQAPSGAISWVSFYWTGLDAEWKACGSYHQELFAGELSLENTVRKREGRTKLVPPRSNQRPSSENLSCCLSQTFYRHASCNRPSCNHRASFHHRASWKRRPSWHRCAFSPFWSGMTFLPSSLQLCQSAEE